MGIDSAHSRRLGQLALLALLALGLGVACQTGGAPPKGSVAPTVACALTTGAAPASVTIALSQPVGFSTAPGARTNAQQTAFRQLYETLVTIDCTGAVRPGLAASWSNSQAGLIWQFRLRPRATFWDGVPVTASAIAARWSAGTPASMRLASVTAPNESTLRVELLTPTTDPRFFAHPDLFVARRDSAAAEPIGTGPYRPIEATSNSMRLISTDGQHALELRVVSDARRALDDGVDALVTADAAAIEYARALPGYTLTPLPWSRTYALVARGEAADTTAPPSEALVALARDAVRADTRPATLPFWWRASECAGMTAGSQVPGSAARGRAIAYPRADAIARGIAERLVALAWPANRAPAWLGNALGAASTSPPSALALDPPALRDAIRKADFLALVVPLPRICTALVSSDSVMQAIVGGPFRITPLLDARDYLIHRGTLGTVLTDGDGILRFPGRRP